MSQKGKYDCLLLYSGGKGSAYALYRLVEMGYKVLALTYNNGYFTKSDMENIRMITSKLGVDHVVLTHKNTDEILKESLIAAHTVCRGCFHISSSLAGDYAYRNNISLVVGATLSRGQILENKLLMFYKQGISDVSEIERELLNIQKGARQMDKSIFDHMDIESISSGAVYDQVKFVDFYRYCDITNQEMISFLNQKDEYWIGRKNYAIYSTNCPVKQIGDYGHLHERGFHYYGSATSWEKRLNHITIENVKEDLKCYPTEKAFKNFSKRVGYEPVRQEQKIDTSYICAYYVSESEISATELREFLTDKLPGYMIPTYFVEMEKIPFTSNNKIDKKALPEPEENINSGVEYVAPESETEEILTEIWHRILDVDKVGVKDNFFDIGGNSILLIQMHSQVDRRFPGKTMMMDLFAYPTVSKLANFIDSKNEKICKYISVEPVDLPVSYFCGGEKDLKAASYSFTLNKQMSEKAKLMSKTENITTDDIWVAVYSYLFAQMAGKKEIAVQSITGDVNRVVSVKNDFDAMKDFIQLFKNVNRQHRDENQAEAYEIEEIKSIVMNKGNESVIPLIFKKGLTNVKGNLMDIYDISLEYDDGEEEMQFQFEYNGKVLKSDKMKELVNSYYKITKMIIDQYEPKGVVL
ncbi:phosphopantetheine-binding protein [Pseudobacteroides cellulosolvens]